MKEGQIKQLYSSPEMKVVEIKAQMVICQSNEQLNRDNIDW